MSTGEHISDEKKPETTQTTGEKLAKELAPNTKVHLLVYADRFAGSASAVVPTLRERFDGVYESVHIIPQPTMGPDTIGLPDNLGAYGDIPVMKDINHLPSPIDTWDTVTKMAHDMPMVFNVNFSQLSVLSKQFQDVLRKGKHSEYFSMFQPVSDVFPNGMSVDDLEKIHRPSPTQTLAEPSARTLPFVRYEINSKPTYFWSSMGSQGIDYNVMSEKGWKFVQDTFDRLEQTGAKAVCLMHFGSAVKKAGTTCFLLPETMQIVGTITREAHKHGMTVGVAENASGEQIKQLAQHADWVYDTLTPPLLMYALLCGDAAPLAQWVYQRPENCVLLLGGQNGMEISDVMSRETEEKPFLTRKQIRRMVSRVHKNTHGEAGSVHQWLGTGRINSTLYSALGCDDQRYLAAIALQFFLPGIPELYYVDALMGMNDVELMNQTRREPMLNRHSYSAMELNYALLRPEVQALNALARFRNTFPAFDGSAQIGFDETYGVISVLWHGHSCSARLDFDAGLIAERELGDDALQDISWRSIATITWTDSAGEHKTNDLLAHPPVYVIPEEGEVGYSDANWDGAL